MIASLSTATPAAAGGSAAVADTGRTGAVAVLGRVGAANSNGVLGSGADAGLVSEPSDGFDTALDALVDQPDEETAIDPRDSSEQQLLSGNRRASAEWWLRTFTTSSTAEGAAAAADVASPAITADSTQSAASEAAEDGDGPIPLNESATDGASASAVPDGRTDIVADAWTPLVIVLPDVSMEQPSEPAASPDATAEQPLPAYSYGDIAASQYVSTASAEASRSDHAAQMISEEQSHAGAETPRSNRAAQMTSEVASLAPSATPTVTPVTLAKSTAPVANESGSDAAVKADRTGDVDLAARAESQPADARRDTRVMRMLAQRISEVSQAANPLEATAPSASDVAASSLSTVIDDAASPTSEPAATASNDNVRRAKAFDDLSSSRALPSTAEATAQPNVISGENADNGHSDHPNRELATAIKRFAGSMKAEATSTPASFTVTVGAQGTTQVSAASPTLPSAATVQLPQEAENLSRLVQSMRVLAREGGSEATIRLNPAHLGEVTISIRVEGGSVSASVQAESGGVRQWLQAQEDTIRGTLAGQGLDLKQFSVEPDAHQQSQDDQQDQAREQQRRRRATKADTTTFEVTV